MSWNLSLPAEKSTKPPKILIFHGNSNDPNSIKWISIELHLRIAEPNPAFLVPMIFSMHNYSDWEALAVKLNGNCVNRFRSWVPMHGRIELNISLFKEKNTNIESGWSTLELALPLGWLGSFRSTFFGFSAGRCSISIWIWCFFSFTEFKKIFGLKLDTKNWFRTENQNVAYEAEMNRCVLQISHCHRILIEYQHFVFCFVLLLRVAWLLSIKNLILCDDSLLSFSSSKFVTVYY